jgi:hypothetical protein
VQVAELDKTVTALRSNRAKMAAQIASDTERLEQLSRDEAVALKAVTDLEAARDARLASKQRILRALAACEKEVAGFTLSASKTTTRTVHAVASQSSSYISSSLESMRGYSTKPGTTPGSTVRVPSQLSSTGSPRR